MQLNKDDRLLANSLLNDIAGNVATLQGKATTTINGKPVNDIELINESITQFNFLARLVKGSEH